MKVSVVIPVFNGELYVADAIRSVQAQTIDDVEIIVVDDGSTDCTAEALAAFGEEIRVLSQPNQGVSVARNSGVAAANGTYVAFLDADDAWLPRKLQAQLQRFDADSELGAVGCGLYVTDESFNLLEERTAHICELAKLLLFEADCGLTSGSRLLVRKDVLQKCGTFDPKLSTSADWDLAVRIAAQYRVASVSEPLVYYRMHGNNMHRGVSRMEHDMRITLDRFFCNTPSAEIAALRRRAFSNLSSTLAGSYWHVNDSYNAFRCIFQSILWHPGGVFHVAKRLAKRLMPRAS